MAVSPINLQIQPYLLTLLLHQRPPNWSQYQKGGIRAKKTQ